MKSYYIVEILCEVGFVNILARIDFIFSLVSKKNIKINSMVRRRNIQELIVKNFHPWHSVILETRSDTPRQARIKFSYTIFFIYCRRDLDECVNLTIEQWKANVLNRKK